MPGLPRTAGGESRCSPEGAGNPTASGRFLGKGGRHRGREDLDKPFHDRRPPTPGDLVAEAFAKASNVREAAAVAIAVFGVPRRNAAFILRLDLTNAIKMMKLAKQARFWRRFWTERLPKRTGRAGPGRTKARGWDD